MPIDIRLINIKEFLKADPGGEVNYTRGVELLKTIANVHGNSEKNILIDLRHTASLHVLSDHQIWSLVNSVMTDFPETFRNKLALVDKETSDVDREEFFVHDANTKGFPEQLFTCLDVAVEWFGDSSIHSPK